MSKIVPKKKQLRHEDKESNQIQSELVSDCDSDQCSAHVEIKEEGQTHDIQKKKSSSWVNNLREVDDEMEENQLENLISSEHLLKNKMDSLINLIKYKYEEEVKLIDFKRTIKEQYHLEKSINDLNKETHFSVDQSFLLNNIDACVKENGDIKKLN